MTRHITAILLVATGLDACSPGQSAVRHTTAAISAAPHPAAVAVDSGGISQSMKLPAQLVAYQEVSIFPKVNGYVKQVLVDIGSKVHKGQLLMTLEDPELQQASLQAREKLARAQADYTISKEHYSRLLEASGTQGAISPMDLAASAAKMRADSALANAERASWEMSKVMLSYLQVTAPFDGVITERNVHPGALVSGNSTDKKPMLELKELDHLRLQVDVPEQVALQLKDQSDMDFYLSALPGRKMHARIARVSHDVNMAYRMERVEMDVYNKGGALTPGMYAEVFLEAGASTGAFTVPRSAVVTSTERKYVLRVRDGETEKTDVITGNSNADKIEVFGTLRKGDEVVINANDEMK